MPYKYPSNIPEGIKSLPAEAQKTWIDIFNNAWEQYKDRAEREGLANATAWAGLKKAGWRKDKEGNWIKTETQGNLNTMELAIWEAYSQTYELKDVEVFGTGEWNKHKITDEDLDNIVNGTNEIIDKLKPKVKLGHDDKQGLLQKSGFPAGGWITKLKRAGNKILVDIKEVPKVLYQLIKNGAYKRISSEILYDYTEPSTQKKYAKVLSAIAFLGADLPAVTNLKDIAALYDSDEKAQIIIYQKAEKYNCECIECGYKMTSDKHCNEIKCPECGGQMRRVERPGPGMNHEFIDQIADEFFAGSPKNKYGTHASKGMKGNYSNNWKLHFSKIGGGSISAAAGGPIRGTVRRVSMIAAGMKPPCNLPGGEDTPARGGPKSPLSGDFSEHPSDYGLTTWATPSDDNLTQEDIRLTCQDLATIKKTALAEIHRRAKDREAEEKKKKGESYIMPNGVKITELEGKKFVAVEDFEKVTKEAEDSKGFKEKYEAEEKKSKEAEEKLNKISKEKRDSEIKTFIDDHCSDKDMRFLPKQKEVLMALVESTSDEKKINFTVDDKETKLSQRELLEKFIELQPNFSDSIFAELSKGEEEQEEEGKEKLTPEEKKVQKYIDEHKDVSYHDAVLAVLDSTEEKKKK